MPAFPDLHISLDEKSPYSTLHIRAKTPEQITMFRTLFRRLASGSKDQEVIDSSVATFEAPLESLVLYFEPEESWLEVRQNVKAGTLSVHWACTASDWQLAVRLIEEFTVTAAHAFLPPDDTRYPVEIEFEFEGLAAFN